MRKLITVAVAGAVALVCAAVALATGTQQTYTDKFGTKKPGKATTTSLKLSSTDPTNTSKNNAPDPARKVVLSFPKGAIVDNKALPQCTATANDFQQKGNGACPAKTLVGTGTASANTTFPSIGDIATTVTAYNKSKGLLLYVQPAPGAPAQPFLINATVSGSKRSGFKLITAPPPNCLPPGTPANGCASGEAPLDTFTLNTKNKTSGSGKNRRSFIVTPPTCPKSKNWLFSVTITYKTDGTKTFTAKSPCTS